MSKVTRRAVRLSLPKEETGAVAITVAFFLVALLALCALVLDLGSLYDHDRELQSAADAGALAGAQEIIYSKGNAAPVDFRTRWYVSANAAQSSVVEANLAPWSPDSDYHRYVTVNLQENHVMFSFARVIGRTEGSVKAKATATLMYLTGVGGLFPVAFSWLQPDHFVIRYTAPSGTVMTSYSITNGASGTAGDQGIYSGSHVANIPANSGSAPVLYNVSVVAQNAANQDLLALPSPAGSLYVPGTTSVVRGVKVDRTINISADPTVQLSEGVTITLQTTDLTDSSVEVDIDGKKVTLNGSPVGSGNFVGSTTMSAPSFDSDSTAEIDVVTVKKGNGATFPGGITLARYRWFQRGYPVIYVDQGANGYSASGGSQATLTASARVKVFVFDTTVMVRVQDKKQFGGDFVGDMWTNASTKEEVAIALGLEPMPSGLRPTPDISTGGNHNGFFDIGEIVPLDPGWSVGHWKDLPHAVGQTVTVALCSPRPGGDDYQIEAFAAFQVATAEYDSKHVALTGKFIHWIDVGQWTPTKPSGVYIETAVLTE